MREDGISTFPLGAIMMTSGVYRRAKHDKAFERFVLRSLDRHASKDWGDLCGEDKGANDAAVDTDDRLLSAYEHEDGTRIWIITEARGEPSLYTTILFPTEY